MRRARRLAWVGFMAMGLAAAPAHAAHLRGQVLRVGFSGSGQNEGQRGADHYRIGFYAPVRVELTNDDPDTFRCVIEARQVDRDGDEVVARREVMVNGTRSYYLYVPGGEAQGRSYFSVRVLQGADGEGGLIPLYDDQNQPVRELTPTLDPTPIDVESRVILDITEVNSLSELVRDAQLNHPVTVLRVLAKDLPDEPAGLEMADTIVWDGGDPRDMDLGQYRALQEWTRRGGRLVIGVSRNWQQLNEKFSDLLPARLTGTATMSEVNAKWAEDLSAPLAAPFDPPLSYCPVTLSSLTPGALPILPEGTDAERPLGPDDPLLVVRRAFGRGEVILVTAELRELTDPRRRTNLQTAALLRRVAGLRNEQKKEDNNNLGWQENLFRYVEQQTGFQVMTQVYLLLAFVFVVAYVGLVTGGSWAWLKKRKLVQHAWASFALVAVVASVAGLAVVHVIRGVGLRVQELAFVDATAGSTDAGAIVYFGLKTPTHVALDLRVATQGRAVEDTADGTTVLRPLPLDTGPMNMGGAQFKAGQRYEAVAALGELHGVPLRATLKQFEGLWRGPLKGRLNAALRREKQGGINLHPDSWVHNQLGTDLQKCYLLVPVASLNWPDRKNPYEVRSYYLGDIANGQRLSIGQVNDETLKAAAQVGSQKPKLNYLSDIQKEWLVGFGARSDTQGRMALAPDEQKIDLGQLNNALMLVSTFDEIDREMRVQVQRSQGQHLDRSLALTRETALLIGFSADPGPAALCWRPAGSGSGKNKWKPLDSEDGRKVVYRISIPIGE